MTDRSRAMHNEDQASQVREHPNTARGRRQPVDDPTLDRLPCQGWWLGATHRVQPRWHPCLVSVSRRSQEGVSKELVIITTTLIISIVISGRVVASSSRRCYLGTRLDERHRHKAHRKDNIHS
ncbi:hypothetical protein BCV70DRAFT_34257 [Testicularia cyperi]|uniref:Uncharacterized protein n=1 Tax=Testicularia cyperi TaxID=1882483 RepID=A0A317XJZ5_9BASI|nr:hypothetical protein BCV70DRAFT_34257 [Testicularia cyperi]